jgi:cytochrome c oxidase cbb3-type subunit III
MASGLGFVNAMKPFRSASQLRCLILVGGVLLLTFASGCQRNRQILHETAAMSARAGSKTPSGQPDGGRLTRNPYEGNAYATTEGQRLYDWYNCSACHARGGGAIGPALMDDVWTYGKDPGNIYASIVEGRSNGMPSWRGKMPEYQVWQLVSYVQALGADRSIASPPGPRQDHMQAGEGSVSR